MIAFENIPFGRTLLASALFLMALSAPARAEEAVFPTIMALEPPVGLGAQEPSLFAMSDGRVLISWTEPEGRDMAVKIALGGEAGWSAVRTVVRAGDLMVNWADFPSVAAFGDGTLAAHWLRESGAASYEYDLHVALSHDEGRSWGKSLKPHRDEAGPGEYGFATLLPMGRDRMLVVWLDGRTYADAEEEMQLRAATLAPDGTLSGEAVLDMRTCSCCQTSAAVTGDGTVLVAYRDRTEGEIRDISLVRMADGAWSEPVTVHADGWWIAGCPVNGPAIDTEGRNAVVAWFTAAGDVPVVKVAFSEDGGRGFADALRVDQGRPTGRVDAVMLDDGTALVTWIEVSALGEVLFACRVVPGTGCDAPRPVTINTAPGSINFPRMVRAGRNIYIAWSQPERETASGSGGDATIRMMLARR